MILMVKEGMIFHVRYPFIREKVTLFDGDGYSDVNSWRPGVRSEMVYPDDCEAVADAIGEMILTVVSVHKPGKYPPRVFFTRQWVSPDGKKFGKGTCRCVTLEKFRRTATAYMHEFRVEDSREKAA